MPNISCRKEGSLSDEEKKVFLAHLDGLGMSGNIWSLFDEWAAKSGGGVEFFFLKVFKDADLIGVGLFLKIKPFDLRASYSGLRKSPLLNGLGRAISALARNCVYISFRNLITSNLARPFFFREPGLEERAMRAILAFLKGEKEADMVTIIDTAENDGIYRAEGFVKYACPSEAYLDAGSYGDVSEYLREHRSLKKNLSRKKIPVATQIKQGPLSEAEKLQMKDCVECSAGFSRVSNPCQDFFEKNIFQTAVFDSPDHIHILIKRDGRIIGFHTFLVCGSHLGGVLGGFNREYSKGSFAYERVIVASLDYAIKNGISRVHYSLIDNHTKLRLVPGREPCGLYFFSRNPMNRMVFELTYRFNDINGLSLLEKEK